MIKQTKQLELSIPIDLITAFSNRLGRLVDEYSDLYNLIKKIENFDESGAHWLNLEYKRSEVSLNRTQALRLVPALRQEAQLIHNQIQNEIKELIQYDGN